MTSQSRALVVRNAAVALVYVATARLGLLLAFAHTNATAVWPPSGIALAAVLLYGPRFWPGIFLGAFAANWLFLASGPAASLPVVALAAVVATGNTLEAVVGGGLVRRFIAEEQPFDRAEDCLSFICLGALAGPCFSATVGTVSFSLFGGDWSHSGAMWLTWWLGDAVGALVVAPLLVTWEKRHDRPMAAAHKAEGAALVAFLVLIEAVVFLSGAPLEYLVFPVLFWTAFRFGQFETASMVGVVTVTFLGWTLSGAGPFAGRMLNDSLLYLQSYLGVAAASTLLLSTLVAARSRDRARLKDYQDELERRVEERTVELRRTLEQLEGAKERAEEADNLKSAFLATMSHELRTPLNSIIGFTGILVQKMSGPLNEEQEKQLGMVRTSATHLLSLIGDILDISKIEAGQLTLSHSPFAFDEVVAKAVQTVRPLAEKKGVSLSMDIAGEVTTLTGDVRRVEQILLNLLGNAVKFTERGEISVNCLREGGCYRTWIRDTGIGIAAEELPRLFQPFRQVDSGLSRKYEGTGLGLSICKRLVEFMGGTIEVESRLGVGSLFSFALPLEKT